MVGENRRSPVNHLDWFLDQVGVVLDPLATLYIGRTTAIIRPILARAWAQEFGDHLREHTLSDCAAALAEGRPWLPTLWSNGW